MICINIRRTLTALLLVVISAIFSLSAAAISSPQTPVSLDSCRSMALSHNKQLMISRERINTARYQNRQAFAAYLPALDFTGAYMYNQRELSIFDSDQLLPTKSFDLSTGKYEYNLVKNPVTGQPVLSPDGKPIPETVALIPKEAMEYDIHNVFFGAVTLTQPLYMGGKIVALNKITNYAQDIAKAMHHSEAENVIYAVDAAYWQVVSLRAKHRLALSYVSLLDSLDHNVALMVAQGVATASDKLSVDVKLNAAQVDLQKVENGLALSRMALAQVCGLPVNQIMTLADEDSEDIADIAAPASQYDMQQVYDQRPDLQALRLGIDVAEQQRVVARASMLPQLALVGAYSFSNPNMFDGFKKRFAGAFSVGAMLTIPIWHWGGNYNKVKEADSKITIMRLQLQDAESMVSLQVSQASFRAQEAVKTYMMTRTNLAKADDNLRQANIGFREGVMTSDNVMEAQTAWLKANSECIDAMIDVHLCDTYLAKSLGTLATE